MLTISWTRVIDGMDWETHRAPTRDGLWRAMLHKAENPVLYVPAITSSRIVERYPDGFLRESRRGERFLVQRVTPNESAGVITFRHRDSTDLSVIRNQIGTDDTGRLTLTLSITLDEGPTETALSQSEYLRDLDSDFCGTLKAMTVVLRRTALHGRPNDGP
ncbi:AtaL-like protein [Kitasatospora sp. NPDC056651]|uniref:AtaL-like protein n=1 Tax=Kitasatospora sp. NPDC056651 TaxID=3345892 RepID=UPI0036D17B52